MLPRALWPEFVYSYPQFSVHVNCSSRDAPRHCFGCYVHAGREAQRKPGAANLRAGSSDAGAATVAIILTDAYTPSGDVRMREGIYASSRRERRDGKVDIWSSRRITPKNSGGVTL